MKQLNSIKISFLSTVFIVLVIVSIGASILFSKIQDFDRKSHLEKYELISNSLSEQISLHFWEQYSDLKSISENLNLTFLSPQELQNKLNKEASKHSDWDLLLIVDPQGGYLSSNTFDTRSTSIDLEALKANHYNTENWFQAVLNNNFSESQKLKGVYVTDFKIDNIINIAYKERKASLSFSAPIKNTEGQTVAIITARVNPGWFERTIQNFFLKYSESLSSPEFQILNGDNYVIFDYAPAAQNSSSQITHDYDNVLLKKKLDAINNTPTPWHQLSSNKSGYFEHKNSALNQIYSYNIINNERFLNGLNWKIIVRGNASNTLKFSFQQQWTGTIFLGVLAILSLAVAFFWSNSIKNEIIQFTNIFQKNKDQENNLKHSHFSPSNFQNQNHSNFTNNSHYKNQSLEKTSEVLKEISGMINTSTREVENVNNTAHEVNSMTLDTQKWMDELTKAMKAIQDSNARISALVKIIEEIGEKTEIIDDIVFKTQLLSFNASVEAERAGEHGRGFSVVAQEVGNLAQLSGKAATEISGIVKKSIREADIVSKENKMRVERGEVLTHETYEKLANVIRKVEEIFKSTKEIALANKHQGEGLSYISSNLNTLNSDEDRYDGYNESNGNKFSNINDSKHFQEQKAHSNNKNLSQNKSKHNITSKRIA